ncbi:MAG: acyl carrier protein [Egibacteraceae bacterium]
MTTIHPRLVAALEDLFGIPAADLRPDADLEADLQLDSLAIVELQYALEEATGVHMGADEAQLHTLGDLRAAVEAALRRGEPAVLVVRAEKPVAFVRKASRLAALLRTTSTRRDPRGALRLARRGRPPRPPHSHRGRPQGPLWGSESPHSQRSFPLGPLVPNLTEGSQ